MTVTRADIVDNVTRLINEVGRSPYLFVGSGFSPYIFNYLSRRAYNLRSDKGHLR